MLQGGQGRILPERLPREHGPNTFISDFLVSRTVKEQIPTVLNQLICDDLLQQPTEMNTSVFIPEATR
jgi:hypothetical protein